MSETSNSPFKDQKFSRLSLCLRHKKRGRKEEREGTAVTSPNTTERTSSLPHCTLQAVIYVLSLTAGNAATDNVDRPLQPTNALIFY